jgi:hypothetical protein
LIRGLLDRICSTAERILTATPTGDEIRKVALDTYHSLSRLDGAKASESVREDLALAARHLAGLEWIDSPPSTTNLPDPKDDRLPQAREWRAALPKGGVLEGGSFAAGAGVLLDVLDETGSDEERGFALAQAERVLRHVEVKREHSLAHASPGVEPARLIVEKHGVAILFTRVALRHRDLRFLNAALKMNDWSLKRSGGAGPEQRARFLLSLAEQESAMRALL